MHRTTIYLDEETLHDLRRLAAQTGKSQAQVIREAIRRLSGAVPVELPASIGMGRSGHKDTAARDEELLERWVKGESHP